MASDTDHGSDRAPGVSEDGTDGSEAESIETLSGRTPTPPTENRARNAAVWGLVGALSFGVLHQAYLFLGGRFLGVVPVAGIAVFVGVVVALTAYRTAALLAESNEQG